MPAYAELSTNEIPVIPGREHSVTLSVRNVGTGTESYVIIAVGLCAGWTLLDPPTVTLFAGESQQVRVTLRPPRAPSVTAGPTPLTLRVVPHGEPDEAVTIDAELDVAAFDDRRLTIVQPVVRGRRGATVDVVFDNQGNQHANVKLGLTDGSQRLAGRFEPPSVGVDPGQSALTRLQLRARGLRWTGGSDPIAYTIDATQDAHPTAVTQGTMLQAPIVSGRPWAKLAGVGAVAAALVGGWFLVAKPAIDDAAGEAVDEAIASMPTVPVTDGGATPGSTAPTATTPGGEIVVSAEAEGEAYAFRLPVSAPVGEVERQDYVVPAGQRLRLTDVVLQNPNRDAGQAALKRNNDVLLAWNLNNVIGDDVKQFITPLELVEGDTLSFEVTCAAAGDPAAGVCTTATSFSGRLLTTD